MGLSSFPQVKEGEDYLALQTNSSRKVRLMMLLINLKWPHHPYLYFMYLWINVWLFNLFSFVLLPRGLLHKMNLLSRNPLWCMLHEFSLGPAVSLSYPLLLPPQRKITCTLQWSFIFLVKEDARQHWLKNDFTINVAKIDDFHPNLKDLESNLSKHIGTITM